MEPVDDRHGIVMQQEADAAQRRPPSPHHAPLSSRAMAIAGVLGGLLYLAGDFLFYGRLGSGHDFRSLPAMAERSDALLIAGGVVAPIASAGYIAATFAIYLRLRERDSRWATGHLVGWAGMFLTGIAYHALFTTRGFAAKLSDPESSAAMLARIEALMNALYVGEVSFGAIGTVAFMVAVLRGGGLPRWTLLLLPTAWSLASASADAVPAPVGALVKGGWINGWFTLFFFVAYLISRNGPTRVAPAG